MFEIEKRDERIKEKSQIVKVQGRHSDVSWLMDHK